jgi:hypothetical protein
MTSTEAVPTIDASLDAGVDGGVEEVIDDQALARASLSVARRCSAGATIWCLCPQWPEHARHLAVEFVHPVVVGARALPAVALDSADPVAALRMLSRNGDVVIAVGRAAHSTIVDLMARCDPWGLTSVWIGAGERPRRGAADHLIWIDDHPSTAPYDGRLVLRYHLLWEMTHICFDHPGALTEPEGTEPAEVCITCSDQGTVAEVSSVGADGLVAVRTSCGPQLVDVSLVGPVVADDLLLIHAGTAIARLDQAMGDAR